MHELCQIGVEAKNKSDSHSAAGLIRAVSSGKGILAVRRPACDLQPEVEHRRDLASRAVFQTEQCIRLMHAGSTAAIKRAAARDAGHIRTTTIIRPRCRAPQQMPGPTSSAPSSRAT